MLHGGRYGGQNPVEKLRGGLGQRWRTAVGQEPGS